jgi:hypothetical protein
VTAADNREQRIRALAQEQWLMESIDFDAHATVSEGDDNGAYVQAWLWVDFAGTELDKENDDDDETD